MHSVGVESERNTRCRDFLASALDFSGAMLYNEIKLIAPVYSFLGGIVMSKFFTANKIFENVTQIIGLAGEQCYLIEGTEKALLIDGLTGIGSLKAFVRELTDLPVELVLTHGHVDHGGAAFEYGVCYVHPADIGQLYEGGDPERRYGFATGSRPTGAFMPVKEDIIPLCPVRTLPVYDGHVFDLGGVQIEAIAVPGHTEGTLVFLDRAHRVIYSGDACNPNTLLGLNGSTTIETYKQSLLHFMEFYGDIDVLYGGHGPMAVPKCIIEEAIELCDEIMAGTDDQYPMEFLGRSFLYARGFTGDFRRRDGKLANIAYKKETIFNK